VNLTYYSAAWTDSGFFLTCEHRHSTVGDAFACLPCADGYVVAVEEGAIRSLSTEEEAEFQSIVYAALLPAQLPRKPVAASLASREEGETLLEFAFRIMKANGFHIAESDVTLTSMHSRGDPKLGEDRPRCDRDGRESQAA
jgi:hypothetical protein